MTRKRGKIRVDLAFSAEERGEAPSAAGEGMERVVARDGAERPAAKPLNLAEPPWYGPVGPAGVGGGRREVSSNPDSLRT